MRIIPILIVVAICSFGQIQAKSAKKTTKGDIKSNIQKPIKLPGKQKFQPAILAIQILDPKEKNKTSSKRTIESSLGYGYQDQTFYGATSRPRYEVYKYSQRDIPAYQGSPKHHQNNYDIQESLSYRLPTLTEISHDKPGSNLQYYQPGTTLYSNINNQGHIGGLSDQIPHQQQGHTPVILLRVYSNQLTDPSTVLHPNLPQTHPHANNINSLDLQSLLSNYVTSMLQQTYQSQPQYHQAPQQLPQYHQALQQQPQYHQAPQQQPQYHQAPQPQPQYHQAPQPQPQYVYQPQQQITGHDSNLLTHENYPDEAHTRVIFKTPNGGIKTSQAEQTQHGSSASYYQNEGPQAFMQQYMNIQVQDNRNDHAPQTYSNVEVQTPDVDYGYANQPEVQQQETYAYPEQQEGNNALYYKDEEPQNYVSYQEEQRPGQENVENADHSQGNYEKYVTEEPEDSYIPQIPQQAEQPSQSQQLAQQQYYDRPNSAPSEEDEYKPHNYHAHPSRKQRSRKTETVPRISEANTDEN